MEITRQTYETFLLLYIDDELEPAERTAVEKFLADNPDLQPELRMLQEAVLTGPALGLPDKSMLYKSAGGISSVNFESYFLLYVDGELSEPECAQVEQFVLQHPHLQEEFTVLRRTRLEPEPIEFTNKALLYRKQTAERRVIQTNWFRIASAAAVTGLAVLLWFGRSTPSHESAPSIALKPAALEQPKQSKSNRETPVARVQADRFRKAGPIASTRRSKAVVTVQYEKNNAVDNKTIKLIALPEKPKAPDLAFQPRSNNLPQRNPIGGLSENPAERTSEPAELTSTSAISGNDAHPGVQTALYREIDEHDDKQTLYIGAAGINRNKLRGLLKKASNLFERKSKRDEDGNTVQIANFEIKTK